MTDQESSWHIDEVAADWAARLDRGPLSSEEEAALEAWLSGDARRRGAMLRAGAVSMLSESAQALGRDFRPAAAKGIGSAPRPLVSRRKMLGWAGTGSVAAATIIALGLSARAAAITTELGEVRRVTLDDGSSLILNTQTSVRVHYSDDVRRIEMLYGEAYFSIVRDGRRLFVLDGTTSPLRTTQALFRIRKLTGRPADILVEQGSVSLDPIYAPGPMLIPAHSRLILSPGKFAEPQPISPDLIARELAWRDGKIAFEGERLDQAAAEFARYSKARIEIRDRDLASEPVTGLFSAGDPAGFGRAIAQAFGAKFEERPGAVILSRPANRS